MNVNFEAIEKAWFKPENIIPINELIDSIEYCGYIDCSFASADYYDYDYLSILYYLKEYRNQELKKKVK